MIHLDTSFLIDYLREAKSGESGPAMALLEGARGSAFGVSIHAACELYVGVERCARPERERATVTSLLSRLDLVHPVGLFAPTFGKLAAHLQQQGEMIGPMDLLIATAAICADVPLVTRNEKHFRRIPGLEVLTY